MANLHERSLQPEEALQRLSSRLVDDPVLQVVDLVLQPIEDREVRVNQDVQEGPQQEVRATLQERPGALAQVWGGPRVPGASVNGEEERAVGMTFRPGPTPERAVML